ncbi:MAG: thiol-activated cytolysin family protein, partial [Bacteroidota bacterium]
MAQDDYEEVSYRVRIKSSQIMHERNGKEITGRARVRIEILGRDYSVIKGKTVEGSFGTISFRDEPVGRVTGVILSVEGPYWSRRINISEISVTVTDDDDNSRRSVFEGEVVLTQGNSKVEYDRGGPVDFMDDLDAIAAEDARNNQFELDGDFEDGDVSGDGFNISSKRAEKYEKEMEQIQQESNDRRICTVKRYTASASFDLNFLTNTSMSAIYPGALISAESIAEGSYVNIPAARKPITLSTDIAMLGTPMIEVERPRLSTIRNAMNKLMVAEQEKGDIPIQANFEIKEVHSKDQLSIALGGHFAYGGGEINMDFSYDSETEQTMKVVKFAQIYYSIDMDQPDSPFDVFQKEDDALKILRNGQTPLVVSRVTYGRIAYFFMRTSASLMEIKAHLDAAYNGVKVEASAEADMALSKFLEQSETKALIIGGDSEGGITAVDGFEGFKDMLREGGRLSKESLGVPVSYTLRYLSDWKVARVNLATSYNKRECREVKATHEDIYVSLDKVEMTKMEESNSEVGFSFSMSLHDESGKYLQPLLTGSRGVSNQLVFDDDHKSREIRNISGQFTYAFSDIKNLWVHVNATVYEYDRGGEIQV